MMRNASYLVVASVLITSACKKQPLDNLSSPPAADASLVASLERGPCRGSCPAYRVDVYGDGKVVFDGQRNVGSMGAHNGTTTPKAVATLVKAIAESEVVNADTAYVMGTKGCGQYYTDLPVSTLTVRVGSRLKKITHDPGCRNAPRFLQTLEAQVDSAARVAAFIAGNGGKTK